MHFFVFFPNNRLILEIFCEKNQSQKSFKLVKKWNFLHLFTFLWSNLCVRGPNHFILVFFPLDLLSNIKYFMKKTFLNYHLFPLKGAVNLWNDIKTLYSVFFKFLRAIHKITSATKLKCTSMCPIFSETKILSHFPSLVVSQLMQVNIWEKRFLP